MMDCPLCKGVGWIGNRVEAERCPRCDGSGVEPGPYDEEPPDDEPTFSPLDPVPDAEREAEFDDYLAGA